MDAINDDDNDDDDDDDNDFLHFMHLFNMQRRSRCLLTINCVTFGVFLSPEHIKNMEH